MKKSILPMILSFVMILTLSACVSIGPKGTDTQGEPSDGDGVLQNEYFTFTELTDGTYSIKATDCNNMPANVTLPSSYNGKAVTSIENHAFVGCTSLTSVTIPDTVTSIGIGAFYQCSALTVLTVPNSVRSIGEGAFAYCTELTDVTIPDSVTSIGTNVFIGCNALVGTTYEKAVYLGNEQNPYLYLWKATDINMVSAILHPSVTFVDHTAFNICTALIGTTYENAIYLGNEQNPYLYLWKAANTNINSVSIHASAKIIGYYAFNNCANLAGITIPESVATIGDHAFSYCTKLENITVAEGNPTYYSEGNCLIQKANKSLIAGCKGSSIPNDVTSIGDYAFNGCTTLTDITIPNSVTSIGEYAFYACTSLASVAISDNVTSIGNRAFQNCTSLASITIPNSVKHIGDNAFYNCTSITTVYYTGTADAWAMIAIGSENTSLTNATIYYSETRPTDTSNKYWHYVDGVPTPW